MNATNVKLYWTCTALSFLDTMACVKLRASFALDPNGTNLSTATQTGFGTIVMWWHVHAVAWLGEQTV